MEDGESFDFFHRLLHLSGEVLGGHLEVALGHLKELFVVCLLEVEGVHICVLQRMPAAQQRLRGLFQVLHIQPRVVAQLLHLLDLLLHLRARGLLELERVMVIDVTRVVVEVALEGRLGLALLPVLLRLVRLHILVARVEVARVVLPWTPAHPAPLVGALFASHVVATTILLDGGLARGAGPRVGLEPIVRLAVVLAFDEP
mmetsp:Transcript_28789/g.77494  ORF Transcript_28789/g.77494 Transcript_28789/m.77494 type:complete len:201 (-) Transcript_28789:879-1481(-)